MRNDIYIPYMLRKQRAAVQLKQRQRFGRTAYTITAIAIIALAASLIHNYTAQTSTSYFTNNCQLMSSASQAQYWYECPAQLTGEFK